MTLNGAITELVMMSEHPMMPLFFKPSIREVIEAISEYEEPKTGHWIHHDGIDDRYEDIVCSVCHKNFTVDSSRTMDIGFTADDFKHCPNCGAEMN